MQINLCHYAKTKSVKVDFVVASGNNQTHLQQRQGEIPAAICVVEIFINIWYHKSAKVKWLGSCRFYGTRRNLWYN